MSSHVGSDWNHEIHVIHVLDLPEQAAIDEAAVHEQELDTLLADVGFRLSNQLRHIPSIVLVDGHHHGRDHHAAVSALDRQQNPAVDVFGLGGAVDGVLLRASGLGTRWHLLSPKRLDLVQAERSTSLGGSLHCCLVPRLTPWSRLLSRTLNRLHQLAELTALVSAFCRLQYGRDNRAQPVRPGALGGIYGVAPHLMLP